MTLPAATARTVGTLAGDPVLYLALDAADHPTAPSSPLHLNSTVIWLGWRGQWRHARQTWRRWLVDPWTEAEAAEVWDEMTWPGSP